jgi:glycosyltransferase involved in cell wall biosynthesis
MARLHLLGLFHTIPRADYSHCAFTGRVIRFGKMMEPFGHEIIEYSNEGSESYADEHVTILSSERFEELKVLYKQEQPNEAASTNSTLYREFANILRRELASRLQPNDIVCHPFGIAHADLVVAFPDAKHLEIGIGYTQCAMPLRVYETYQWMSWHQGKEQTGGNDYQWVCPMGYDIEDWEPSYETGSYLLYFGRVIECKGLHIVKELARQVDLPVRIVGEANPMWLSSFMADAPSNLSYSPPVTGTARSDLLRNAYAMLMPTRYTEPFGGAGVEGMLCGTPLIASDFGAFSETVIHGYNGFRCHTLGDWIQAVRETKNLNRRAVASTARITYSLQNVGRQMDKIVRQIENLSNKGWYSLDGTDAVWER